MSPQDTVTSYNYSQEVIFIVSLSGQLQQSERRKMNFFFFSLHSSYFKEAAYIPVLSVIIPCGAFTVIGKFIQQID